MNGPNKLVVERIRAGRRQVESTCYCSAARYPHRLGAVKGCHGDLVCFHGLPMPGHPDYDERCEQCAEEEYEDMKFDSWRDERLN